MRRLLAALLVALAIFAIAPDAFAQSRIPPGAGGAYNPRNEAIEYAKEIQKRKEAEAAGEEYQPPAPGEGGIRYRGYDIPEAEAQQALENYNNYYKRPMTTRENCWSCSVIEAVYTYTFSFAHRIFSILSPIMVILLGVAFMFWLLWYVWAHAILTGGEGEGGSSSIAKDAFGQFFALVFVIGLLMTKPATIFNYSIDPIISGGAGFASWILSETRADGVCKDSRGKCKDKNIFSKESLRDCAAIKVGPGRNGAAAPEYLNEDILRSLVCMTLNYSDTYTTGIDLGFKMITNGLSGVIQKMVGEVVVRAADVASKLAALTGPVGVAVNVALFLVKIWLSIAYISNIIIIIMGAFVVGVFFYMAFTYVMAVVDIIIRLAMVAAMMPIAIASWAFESTRKKLSSRLFFDVVHCAFRLIFLGVAMCITTYLLNELFTHDFSINIDGNNKDMNLNTLYNIVGGNDSAVAAAFRQAFQWTGIPNIAIIGAFVNNTGMISAMVFITLVAYMLLEESLKMADNLSSAIVEAGTRIETLENLKTLTTTAFAYILSARRAATIHMRIGAGHDNETRENMREYLRGVKNDPPPTSVLDCLEAEREDVQAEAAAAPEEGLNMFKAAWYRRRLKDLDKRIQIAKDNEDNEDSADNDEKLLREQKKYEKRRKGLRRSYGSDEDDRRIEKEEKKAEKKAEKEEAKAEKKARRRAARGE